MTKSLPIQSQSNEQVIRQNSKGATQKYLEITNNETIVGQEQNFDSKKSELMEAKRAKNYND